LPPSIGLVRTGGGLHGEPGCLGQTEAA